MPAYALPGTDVGPRRARVLGVVAIALTIVAVTVWHLIPDTTPADRIRIALITARVGEGVAPGTDVRLDGVRVGSVSSIDRLAAGKQRIILALQRSQLFGLTDELSVDYAAGNLFGISVVDLHPGAGGAKLAEGSSIDLTGRHARRLRDATLAALLESTGGLTADVLTSKLAAVLAKAAHDVRALSPMLQAIGTTVRAFTDTQQLPPSVLFDRFGSTLRSVPAALGGGLEVLQSAYANQYLSTPEHMARYGRMFGEIQSRLLPVATRASETARQQLGEFMPMTIAVLDRLSASVGTPQRSEQPLGDLLDRLGAAFHDTPNGPMLNASVDLEVVPALAAPLSTVLGLHPAPGGR